MVKGVGVDIVDIKRIKSLIEKDAPFLKKVFSIREFKDLVYFARLGIQFVSEFILKKKK